MLKLRSLVRIIYRYLDNDGRARYGYDTGYVVQNYRNGQFVISDHPRQMRNPRRFESLVCHFVPSDNEVAVTAFEMAAQRAA